MQREGKKRFSLPTAKSSSAIISLAVIFGLLGFVYSFFGLLESTKNIISLDPFRLLTVQEIGGHFLFGFIVGIPLRNLKASILIGLMALTIDSDHLLNIAGFHIQGRIDHSIPFAIISSILMGFIAYRIYFKILGEKDASLLSGLSISNKIYKNAEKQRKQYRISGILFGSRNDNNNDNDNNKQNSFFILFSCITLSACLSHIAYDVFVDDEAKFPLFAPFSFSEFIIPNSYGLPIELVGCLTVLFISLQYRDKTQTNAHTAFRNVQGN
jgi:hypothetical protein